MVKLLRKPKKVMGITEKNQYFVRAALMAALTAAGGLLKIPLGMTSMTLQTFFMALAGFLLPGKWAAASQGIYVLLGLLGLPIFTKGGGIGYIFEPTFGFLLASVPASAVVARLSRGMGKTPTRPTSNPHRIHTQSTLDPHPIRTQSTLGEGFSVFRAVLAGYLVVYAIGLPYMALIWKGYLGVNISLWTIFKVGFLWCLPGDGAKALLLTFLAPRVKKSLERGQ